MDAVSRLSALPGFFYETNLWDGALNPKAHLSPTQKYRLLRSASATHRWGLDAKDGTRSALHAGRVAILDIAQSILERGQWTLPTWRIEQHIAQLLQETPGWDLRKAERRVGSLGLDVRTAPTSSALQQALVTARWACEEAGDFAAEIWGSQRDSQVGSDEERTFLEQVLIPVLGFPLLDYLHLQRDLVSLGLTPVEFAQQRADFILDTHRGLKLVIEVDGAQHRDELQMGLDRKRDKALKQEGWTIWRVATSSLNDLETLRKSLSALLKRPNGKSHWGVEQLLHEPRSRGVMTAVWGATTCARLQFLLLEAVRVGILSWDAPWEIAVLERDTEIAEQALEDFSDWFSRLCALYGESSRASITLLREPGPTTDLVLDVGIIHPYLEVMATTAPIAWSRPANRLAPTPGRRFAPRPPLAAPPSRYLLESFVQDFFRKSGLREGQYEILERILTGRDVVGLLPTGAGKSLTYQLSGLLLGGLTVYVSPLKSLLQDQHERLLELGIELAQPISSALNTEERAYANALLKSGRVRYLLVAPERFLIQSFRDDLNLYRVQHGEVCQVVIDECHCVSEWGHDFRPAYLSLSRTAKDRTLRLGVSAPLVALTGTASTIVLADVQRELGILGADAVIRAKRLDRDEIALRCVALPQQQKHKAVKDIASRFLLERTDQSEGLLVFCRFAGGREGVLAVSADVLAATGSEQLRFFCGTSPKWTQYVDFLGKQGTPTAQLPSWALTPDGTLRDWEDVKADVQRQYISGLNGSFRVMVATHAFGMGIDKPSIREVVHFMAPPSPEAYYQEVGRAGRDREASVATLLFSDEDPRVTDELLSPGNSIAQARAAYEKHAAGNRYKGGDFIRTFYFHQNSFSGPEIEAAQIVAVLREIRKKLAKAAVLSIGYVPASTGGNDMSPRRWNEERNLEYAIVRLILLGVVHDYVKDYVRRTFELELVSDWVVRRDNVGELREYLAALFRAYVRRYQVRANGVGERAIREAESLDAAEQIAATSVVAYVYDHIERKRREASRQMLTLARKGVKDADAFRRDLILYLQVSERFTAELEGLAAAEDIFAWTELVKGVTNGDEIRELHQACGRVLESFPTHPGLLLVSAVSRLAPSADDLRLSEDELRAALRYASEIYGTAEAKAAGDAALDLARELDTTLADGLRGVFGIWLIYNGREQEAVERFFVAEPVREYWLADVLKKAQAELPPLRGM